jgi:hypothetical protein
MPLIVGLHRQLIILRDLIADVRGDPGNVHNPKGAISHALHLTPPHSLVSSARCLLHPVQQLEGLYKQLSILRDLIADVRGDPGSVHNLKDAIAGNVEASGLQADCPLREGVEMSAEEAAAVEDEVGGVRFCVSVDCVWCFAFHFKAAGQTVSTS